MELVASWQPQSVSLMADSIDFFGDAANCSLSLAVAALTLHVRSQAALFERRVHGRLRGVRARATTPSATWR